MIKIILPIAALGVALAGCTGERYDRFDQVTQMQGATIEETRGTINGEPPLEAGAMEGFNTELPREPASGFR